MGHDLQAPNSQNESLLTWMAIIDGSLRGVGLRIFPVVGQGQYTRKLQTQETQGGALTNPTEVDAQSLTHWARDGVRIIAFQFLCLTSLP